MEETENVYCPKLQNFNDETSENVNDTSDDINKNNDDNNDYDDNNVNMLDDKHNLENEEDNNKDNMMIFSSILRYQRYKTKKGNIYFDFKNTNLSLNEKDMLVQSSNFYHLFDIKSLLCPHIYLNVNSHININISDYKNYLKSVFNNDNILDDKNEIVKYSSCQEFIFEAVEQVEHIEVFTKVQIVKKLFLFLNQNVAEKMKNYINNIPIINSNDYVLVQTNLKNDLLLGYVKSSKYNLFFEILNMKKCFHSFLNENIIIYEINEDKEGYFKTIDGKKYLKEQIIYEKKDLLKNLDFYLMYYCDYYFSSNSIIEWEKKYNNNNNNINCVSNNNNNNNNCSHKNNQQFIENDYNDMHLFFSFNICIKSVKNNLFLHIIFNDNNLKISDEYFIESFPHYEDLNLYNKQFDINKMDKNLFKSNTFFINNLYYHLKCKLLCVFKFINMSVDDFMTDIHISQIKKKGHINEKDSYMLYTFNIHTLSNEGMVYIFFCNLYISNMFKENNFEISVPTYLHFQLNKQNSYKKLKLIKYNSKFLYSLCYKEKGDCKKKKKKNDLHEKGSDNNRDNNNSDINNNNSNNNNNGNYYCSHNTIFSNDEKFIFNSSDFNTLDQIKNDNYLIKDEKINKNFIFERGNYKYTFILISSKCDIIIITLRNKKKKKEEYNNKLNRYSSCSINENVYLENVEIINYSSSNNKNTNNIICNTIINKYNYEINNNIKNKNKSCVLFEIVCFYENGEMQKYIYTCSLKNENFEFFLNNKEEEKTKSINCKKCFFKPILFPFNEELLNKKKNSNDLVLYNIKLSDFKNLIYIYFQEKKIEGISLTINNECLIINYIKMVSKLLKKILQNSYNSDDLDIVYNFQNDIKNKCHNLSENINISSDSTICHVIKKNEIHNNNIKYNLFTQREVKSSFFEFKYILFGFYDLFLINQKNYTDLNEKKKEEYKKNFINCFDTHSHYNFLNIIKEYINYDYIINKCSYNISNDTQKKKKIKLNFYYFLLIIQYFKKTYIHENKSSFFYMVYNELLQNDKYLKHFYNTYNEIDKKTNIHLNDNDNNIDTDEIKKNEETDIILKNMNFFDNYQLINIRKYDLILFSFLFHMYNFCLKQNGLSNDEFNSHITYFLINKKMKKYKKKYRYICKKKIDTNENNDNNINMCDSKNYKEKNFEEHKNNMLNKQNESLDNLKENIFLSKNIYDNQLSSHKNLKQNKTNINEKYNHNKIIINYLTWKKCLYYIYKIKKYTRKIETYQELYISSILYININLCQIFFILLNILRMNNTNIYTNIHFDIRKNNLDYFYLLIILNFYSLFYMLILDQKYSIIHDEDNNTYISKHINNKKYMEENDKNIISLLSFFNNIYEQNKEELLKNDEKKKINNHNRNTDILYTSSSGVNISVSTQYLEQYLILIYNIIKDKINNIKEDNYIMEKLFFKINCMICNKVCVTNIYNNYYICENNHIFNKCMLTFGCIYKNHIILPTIYILHDINDKLFPITNDHILSYNLQYYLDHIYFCSFCYNFITTQNSFYKKFFLFNQCPFCNHELNIL
ncbi:conserved Plasmodium protein, unknown function [Plasmodium gaboni]|uniref:Uncharacterized protein n=1 Tax=Plasmodium gaboni TaxID=647221 RepID=A0ABY1UQ83_9APIC|nr:conserved Plasmodium protein, unknown function [Plasmodium gaboni]